MNKKLVLALMGMTTAAGIAGAANVDITSDITTSTTWNSTNVYNLTKQIYVKNGATLTIEAGTVCKSDQGSLAVTSGSKIYVNGTKDAPVIMTSINDDLATWRPACQEWGNLTIMGKALISASQVSGVSQPDGTTYAQMEGLTAVVGEEDDVRYGGNDDNDDSGSIHYLSIRYGGKVINLGNELNGLSLGGIGRATDIDHVEIMNNVDDGIEIWGGTVNLKYVNIWNIGDDSFDVDQGWRGKAQFGLIVQGYSRLTGSTKLQGSGVGDNCLEMDGAELADAQPVGHALFYNFTVIGNPGDINPGGDQATEWRDGMRAQFHNTIFMNIGDKVFKNAISDGEHGTMGYGINGVPTLQSLFATSYTNLPTNTAGVDPSVLYQVFTSGKLAEFTDCIFYDTETGSVNDVNYDIMNTANRNLITASSPIQGIQRAAAQTIEDASAGTIDIVSVTNLNPCAANDAVSCNYVAPNDGFFTPAPFIGAFSANNNWLADWTATAAYGMTDVSMNSADPTATIQMTASTFFPTTADVVYTVEESSDMANWAPVATVVGDGSIMSATDLDAFDSAKFYRAIVL